MVTLTINIIFAIKVLLHVYVNLLLQFKKENVKNDMLNSLI